MNIYEIDDYVLVNIKLGMMLIEKIIVRVSKRLYVLLGEVFFVNVDVLMFYDFCMSGVVSVFKKEFGEEVKVWNLDCFIMIFDYFVYFVDLQVN